MQRPLNIYSPTVFYADSCNREGSRERQQNLPGSWNRKDRQKRKRGREREIYKYRVREGEKWGERDREKKIDKESVVL